MTASVYDAIGGGYRDARRPDSRIAARIVAALGNAASVVNVGAGTGSYEPATTVFAVEPSTAMIAQRPAGAAPALQAAAEAIPLPDGYADAALAVLTVHHWADPRAGLAELRRIARQRIVVLTWDRHGGDGFWLTRDYIAENYAWDSRRFLALEQIAAALGDGRRSGRVRVVPVPIPHDCSDGFLAAYWRLPAAYLDPRRRASMSNFALPGAPQCEEGLARLAADVASGAWARRYADLLPLDELDVGYRLVIADL